MVLPATGPRDVSVLKGRHPSTYLSIPRIYRSDIHRTILEDITPARAMQASFTMNTDFDTKRQATIEVWNPDELTPLGDWIVAELDIVDDSGTIATVPLGHYLVIEPDITGDNFGRRGTLELRDLSWILRQSTIDQPYTIPAGVDHGAAARNIALLQGIPSSMINIPNSNTVTPAPVVPHEGDSWLDLMIDVLAGGAMYQPWMANDMRLTSYKVRDISNAPPDAVYKTADGAKIIPPYSQKPEISKLRNRVTVRKKTPGEPTIAYTATVTDRSSPAHPDRLGEMMGTDQPIILGTVYEEGQIETEAEAQALAEARLSELVSFLDRVHIETYVDHTSLEEHQILDLDLEDGDDHYAVGLWRQRVSTIDVNGPRVTCKRELVRTVSWR